MRGAGAAGSRSPDHRVDHHFARSQSLQLLAATCLCMHAPPFAINTRTHDACGAMHTLCTRHAARQAPAPAAGMNCMHAGVPPPPPSPQAIFATPQAAAPLYAARRTLGLVQSPVCSPNANSLCSLPHCARAPCVPPRPPRPKNGACACCCCRLEQPDCSNGSKHPQAHPPTLLEAHVLPCFRFMV